MRPDETTRRPTEAPTTNGSVAQTGVKTSHWLLPLLAGLCVLALVAARLELTRRRKLGLPGRKTATGRRLRFTVTFAAWPVLAIWSAGRHSAWRARRNSAATCSRGRNYPPCRRRRSRQANPLMKSCRFGKSSCSEFGFIKFCLRWIRIKRKRGCCRAFSLRQPHSMFPAKYHGKGGNCFRFML